MRETAEVMSKTINAIKTMQRRAVKSLRKTPEFKEMAKEYE
jgi:DNA-directed RNA polymerase specialized sigma24 family protein